MGFFLAIFITVTIGSVAIFLVVKMSRSPFPTEDRFRICIIHFVAVTLMLSANILCGGTSLVLRLPFDMILSLLPMLVLTSSIWEEHIAQRMSRCLSSLVWMSALFYILDWTGVLYVVELLDYIFLSGILSIFLCQIFLLAIFLRMREIRHIMKNGNVWSSVCLTMDILYLLFVIMYVFVLLISTRFSTECTYIISAVVAVLMACEYLMLGLRVGFDSLFVIWHKQERRIVESMKISQNDVVQEPSKINDIYKDIYTRIVTLFETEKPYLNSELTINDIVKVTFTNKLYISRAISQFTGRNFCQFVNYYRVYHSIQIYRDNPDMKVIDMATQSGFNSTVSYSMAFRLYMGECPSDWCRKEKLKLRRRKK